MKINKKGDFELDQLGKLILMGILLIILITIVSVYIGGELTSQENRIKDLFNFF